MSERWIRRTALVLALVVLGLGLTRAALTRFQEKRRAIMQECQAEQKRLALTDPKTLFDKYPTPEIAFVSVASLAPNGTGELVVKGKFVAGSKFLLESDAIEVLKESSTATEYRATLKAPAGIGPEEADIEVYSPVSGAFARKDRAVIVAGKFNWEFQTDNGWRIKAKSVADTRAQKRDISGEMKYAVEFYRGAEAKPFATRDAKLYFSPYEDTQYRFAIEDEAPGGAQGELQKLMEKMGDRNLSQAERDKLMARMESLSQQLVAEMSKMSDPNYIKELQKQKDEFGCETLMLDVNGGVVNGRLRCSQKVGLHIPVKGTLVVGQ